MKTRLAEYLPLRDVPLALGYSTLWFVGLWVADYPVADSLGVIVFAYITFWASRLVTAHLLNFFAQRLNRAVLRTADELGIEMPDEQTILANMSARALIIVAALIIATIAVMLGASFALLVAAVSLMGLPSLGAGFTIAGLALLVAGLLAVGALFMLAYTRLSRLQASTDGVLNSKISERFGYIRHSERLAQWLSGDMRFLPRLSHH